MSRSAEASPSADPISPPPADSLKALREELDALDDRLLDLLIQRAAVVERVSSAKRGAGPLRPGREAAILRRLLGQHKGPLPRSSVIRIWREIFAASVAQQQTVQVAVCDPAMDGRFLAAAREHLGVLTPMRVYGSPAQAIGEVVDGRAGAAILPLPGDSFGDAAGPGWWPGLLHHNAKGRIHVVARLPFWASRPDGAPSVQALIVANTPADPSGNDISLIALEVEAQLSLGSLSNTITAAGFRPLSILVHRPTGVPAAQLLVEVEGFVTADDTRLSHIAGLQAPPLIVGAYAIAFSEESRSMTTQPRPMPRPEIMAIAPYVGGASAIPGATRIIKLSSNEGAFGPPPAARAAIAAGADKMARYPDGSARALREAIGTYFGLDPARIVCGNGSDELLSLLIHAYGGPGTEIVMSQYGFSIYEIFGTLAGSVVRKAPETDLVANVDALLAAVTDKTTLVFLTNPNNPTGSVLPLSELKRLRDGLPPQVLLVIDAAYAEYVDRPDYDAGASLVEAGENTVMTRTFSKIWGLGGARLGWCYGPAAITDVLNRLRAPFNVNNTAASAGVAALSEPNWAEMSRAHNSAARARVTAALTASGIRVWPSEANFVLADFGSADQARAADAALKADGIIARVVASYGLAQCLRITIGTDEQCQAVTDCLSAFMAGAKHPATADA